MLIRAGNPESFLSGGDPGVKSFPMVPHTRLYMAWGPGFYVTLEEFNSDETQHRSRQRLGGRSQEGGVSLATGDTFARLEYHG